MLSEGSGGDAIGVSEDAGFTLRKTNPKPFSCRFRCLYFGLVIELFFFLLPSPSGNNTVCRMIEQRGSHMIPNPFGVDQYSSLVL